MDTKKVFPNVRPIQFPFNERKALAAATYLLAQNGGTMNYMRLLKLLYFADRMSFQEYGRPITGDRYVAMKLGPVLSTVYDRIKDGVWGERIRKIRCDLRLVGPEFIDPLSEAEIAILDEVTRTFRTLDHWNLSNLSHDLPEWNETPNKANGNIPVESILRTLGKKSVAIREIREEAREESFFEEVFSDP